MSEAYFSKNELHVLCVPGADGWRVHARPGALPPYLKPFFPEGEAFPVVAFDMNDLRNFMTQRNAPLSCSETRLGSFQVSAEGEAVAVLGKWLAGAMASGVR